MQTLDLGKTVFFWRMTTAPNSPNPVPDFVDFSFDFREDYQLIIQKRNAATLDFLERIYRENYNAGYLQEGHALAENYGGDFITFIDTCIKRYRPTAKRISEIGAGGCYLLKVLKAKGYDSVAIDPSPVTQQRGDEYGIEVVPSFYPITTAIPPSDAIIHYDVLEHIVEPADFLRQNASDLVDGGLVIFAVPDCTPYLERGDISVMLHEHLNYYDRESLQNVVEASGLEVLDIRPSDYGCVLYCAARVAAATAYKPNCGVGKFEDFVSRAESLKSHINAFIQDAMQPGCSLGCYVPLRALPYLTMTGTISNVRFFDDNPGIHGEFFDGFPIAVENMDDLKANPVSHLLILSAAFGDTIRNRINDQLEGHSISIKCLNDF